MLFLCLYETLLTVLTACSSDSGAFFTVGRYWPHLKVMCEHVTWKVTARAGKQGFPKGRCVIPTLLTDIFDGKQWQKATISKDLKNKILFPFFLPLSRQAACPAIFSLPPRRVSENALNMLPKIKKNCLKFSFN